MNKTNKKSQITIYIIIGMILLIVGGVVFYLRGAGIGESTIDSVFVPSELRPLYTYIATCEEEVATRAVLLAGMQGGFVEVPSDIHRNPDARLPLDDKGVFVVPFWYYEGQDRTPGLDFVQTQISRYVVENLPRCLNDFAPFPNYDIKWTENMTARTLLADDQVVVRVIWPLTVTRGEHVLKHSEFVATVPVRLKKMWDLARSVMDFENKHAWFENLTIDLYSADQEIPTDGMTIECGVKRWRLQDIKNRLEKVLYYNIPRVRIENTAYLPFDEDKKTYESLAKISMDDIHAGKYPSHTPDDAYEYNTMTFKVDHPTTDLKASFEYQPAWGLRLNAHPNQGGVLESNLGRGQKWLNLLCINQWHFVYNVIYPVRVLIRDEKAFTGRGYIFQMAFPIIINKNEAERVYYGVRKFRTFDETEGLCEDRAGSIVEIRARGFEDGVLAAVDLDDVNLTFECFGSTCELGSTTADGGAYRWRGQLPARCTNPFITATKDGYVPGKIQMLQGTTRLDLRVARTIPLNVTVVKHQYRSDTQSFGSAEPLSANEHVPVSLRLLSNQTELENTVDVPGDYSRIRLLAESATYEITALLLRKDIFSGEELLVGGYENRAWTASALGQSDLVIHVFESRPAPTSEKAQRELAILLYEGKYEHALQPTFKGGGLQ